MTIMAAMIIAAALWGATIGWLVGVASDQQLNLTAAIIFCVSGTLLLRIGISSAWKASGLTSRKREANDSHQP